MQNHIKILQKIVARLFLSVIPGFFFFFLIDSADLHTEKQNYPKTIYI